MGSHPRTGQDYYRSVYLLFPLLCSLLVSILLILILSISSSIVVVVVVVEDIFWVQQFFDSSLPGRLHQVGKEHHPSFVYYILQYTTPGCAVLCVTGRSVPSHRCTGTCYLSSVRLFRFVVATTVPSTMVLASFLPASPSSPHSLQESSSASSIEDVDCIYMLSPP